MGGSTGEKISALHNIVETSISRYTDGLNTAVDLEKASSPFLALLYAVPVAMVETAAVHRYLFVNPADLDAWRTAEFCYAVAESDGMSKAYGEERALVYLTMYDLLRAEFARVYRQVFGGLSPSAAGVLEDNARIELFRVAIGNIVRRECRDFLPAHRGDPKSPIRDTEALGDYLFDIGLASLMAASEWMTAKAKG